MAYKITVPFFAFKLQLSPTGQFLAPLHDKSVLSLAEPMHLLAGKYAEAFQKKVLNKGDYLPLVDHQITGDFYKNELVVAFKKAKNGVSFPKFELVFDYFYNERDQGVWGILPVLSLEAFGEDLEQLEQRLEEAVRLDFARNKRLENVFSIVSTIWYDAVQMQQEQLELKTFTLKELENADGEATEQLLPQVATELKINRQVVYGRKREMDQLSRAIKGKFNQNVILVGPSGVGKTALVWELVKQKRKRKIAERIWETTASVLIKELMRNTGWEANLGLLCKELAGSEHILFVRNLMELFEVGQYVGNDSSMADYLLTYISRGEVVLITECSEEELGQIELRNPSFTKVFQLIRLQEPQEDLEWIIQEKVKDIARSRNVFISEDAIQEVIRLNRRFTPYAGMPGKPIRFLESIIFNRHHRLQDKKEVLRITRSEVIRYFCEDTGMPAFMVDPTIPMNLNQIKAHFNSNVFGQEGAVDAVVDVVASVKTAMTRTGKPIASFLFVGPTGVGKTELAKVLAQFMFGSRNRMIRFDMSEYGNPYSVLQLIGTTQGSDGLLTAAVRREPFCVLLFDELEKADATFYDFLLQILSEGRLTDSNGKLVNFCSAIIIMTSNIGARKMQSGSIRFNTENDRSQREELSTHYIREVEKHFRPELYNRIDRIIPFAALDRDTVRFVVDREINLFRQREGIKFRRIDLKIEEEVLDHLGEAGYHEKYGARQIQRTIREELIIPLSEALNVQDFDDQYLVQVRLEDGKPAIHLEADPLGLDLLLEELDKINQADHAGRLRRSVTALKESMFYIKLLSELKKLENEKNKKKSKFWQNQAKGETYSYYLKTKNTVDELFDAICKMEEALCLTSLNLKTFETNLSAQLEEWEIAFFDLKIELYTRLYPKSSTCFFGIYGFEVKQLLPYYRSLFLQKGYQFEAYGVWYRDSYFNEEVTLGELLPDEKLEDPSALVKRQDYIKEPLSYEDGQFHFPKVLPKDVLCGIEFVITGTCAYLFLSPEFGGQKWRTSDKDANVFFVQASESASKSPVGIHRRDFYQRLNARRVVDAETIKDTPYKINREYKKGQLRQIIIEKMDQLFEHNLNKALFD